MPRKLEEAKLQACRPSASTTSTDGALELLFFLTIKDSSQHINTFAVILFAFHHSISVVHSDEGLRVPVPIPQSKCRSPIVVRIRPI